MSLTRPIPAAAEPVTQARIVHRTGLMPPSFGPVRSQGAD